MTGVILLHNGAYGIIALAGSVLGFSGVAIAAVDRRRYFIPDHLVALTALAGLIASAWSDDAFNPTGIVEPLIRAGCYAGIVWLVRWLHLAMRGSQGLGLGDVKLAAAAGCWLDPTLFGLSLSIAAIAAVLGVGLFRRKRDGRRSAPMRIPFGAFWAPVIWLTWLIAHVSRASF